MGMTSGEEAKLMAMRDYILKLARNMSRYGCHNGCVCSNLTKE